MHQQLQQFHLKVVPLKAYVYTGLSLIPAAGVAIVAVIVPLLPPKQLTGVASDKPVI
jgi:hypothetical protein